MSVLTISEEESYINNFINLAFLDVPTTVRKKQQINSQLGFDLAEEQISLSRIDKSCRSLSA